MEKEASGGSLGHIVRAQDTRGASLARRRRRQTKMTQPYELSMAATLRANSQSSSAAVSR